MGVDLICGHPGGSRILSESISSSPTQSKHKGLAGLPPPSDAGFFFIGHTLTKLTTIGLRPAGEHKQVPAALCYDVRLGTKQSTQAVDIYIYVCHGHVDPSLTGLSTGVGAGRTTRNFLLFKLAASVVVYLLCKICTTTAMSRLSEVRPAALRCVFERARRSLTAMDVQYGWVERTATTILFGGRAQTAEVAARQNCVRRHLQVLCAAAELWRGCNPLHPLQRQHLRPYL